MKKISMIFALLLTIGITSAFAANEKISPRAIESFKTEFKSATDVKWEAGSNYYMAAFTMNEQRIFAYYNLEGDLISTARYVSTLQLPINLFSELKNDYDKYWVSDLFEANDASGLKYYVTLENADTKIMLRSVNGSSWSTYQKNKKV